MTAQPHETVHKLFTDLVLLAHAMRLEAEKRGETIWRNKDRRRNKSNGVNLSHDDTSISGWMHKNAFNKKSPLNVTNLFNENSKHFFARYLHCDNLYSFSAEHGETNREYCYYAPFHTLYTEEVRGPKGRGERNSTSTDGTIVLGHGANTAKDSEKFEVIIKRLSKLHEHFRNVGKGKGFEIPGNLTIDQFMK